MIAVFRTGMLPESQSGSTSTRETVDGIATTTTCRSTGRSAVQFSHVMGRKHSGLGDWRLLVSRLGTQRRFSLRSKCGVTRHEVHRALQVFAGT